MTDDGEFKAIVRERMAATGECYTQALRVVLEAARAAVPKETEGKSYTVEELIAEFDGPPRRQPEWGPWDIDGQQCVLWTEAPGVRYQVRLEDCISAGRALFWIAQIAQKTWGRTPTEQSAVLSGLVIALDDVLALQENLSGDGQKLSVDEIHKLVREGD